MDTPQKQIDHDARMKWWREARFGLFIHWGLYAIPAGRWGGRADHAEWIMETAKIPASTYEKFARQFNPAKFDARQWARLAKRAGMKYLVITSKHHDGFALFDSKVSDYDVMSTPFGRDVLRELSDACRNEDVAFCTYHSIMDWHHADYVPRRAWNDTARGDPKFERYFEYLTAQVEEIVRRYAPRVMWFDGEWEDTWTHEHGVRLHDFVRSLDPRIIINNRVDKGRDGMKGMTKRGRFLGDFGTPEQEIPAGTNLGDRDWESCMTMNDHWGYNAADDNWKSTETLVRNLVDTACKGGNYLLNVGPSASGEFPRPCIERLEEIGRWMDVNGESIYGTSASPIGAPVWGRCTRKGSTLYLHLFDWPRDGQLRVPVSNDIRSAGVLGMGDPLTVEGGKQGAAVTLPSKQVDPVVTVVKLEIIGEPRAVAHR
jgi:alpha-L-fucosidase